ncbi:MAG: hypothetical protein KZQ97_18095, partial [Candidatus Thiodiazotropha sp. (ex Dulcina madagascariensis)]|nr:hypothetical protein [Candidatus Thiodiazotropha sp. (ex Dulcina madagascariensis)]
TQNHAACNWLGDPHEGGLLFVNLGGCLSYYPVITLYYFECASVPQFQMLIEIRLSHQQQRSTNFQYSSNLPST